MRKFKALAFDVGGSVFDWKSSIRDVLRRLPGERGVSIDPEAFAMEWRKHMFIVLNEVRQGKLPHMNIDALLPIALQRVAPRFPQLDLDEITDRRLLHAWHVMKVWEDFPPALARLKEKYMVMVLSVLSFSAITDASKLSGITWDGVISCEFLSHYKPDPEAYVEGCSLMGFKPEDVCMVAAHPGDLVAAMAAGMGSAFIEPRLQEPDILSPESSQQPQPEVYDYYAQSYEELADMMCADLRDYIEIF